MVVGTLAIGQTLIILTAGIDLSVGAIMVLGSIVMAKLAVDGGRARLPRAAARLRRRRWRAGCVNGAAGHAAQAAAVHRHARHAEHLLRARRCSTRNERDDPRLGHAGAADLDWATPSRSAASAITYGVGADARCCIAVVCFVAEPDRLGPARLRGRRRPRGGAPGRHPRPTACCCQRLRRRPALIYGIARAGADRPHRRRRARTPAQTDNLDSITAVVIGGTSLFGGRGTVLGTLIGALIVGVFRNGLSLAGVDVALPGARRSASWSSLAVAVDQWIRKVKA